MPVRILAIDGGGIRGIGAARLLDALDGELRRIGKAGVGGSFDLFAGTSTGSIVAAGLAADGKARQSLAPADIVRLYYERGSEMFTRGLFGINPFALLRGKYKQSSKGRVLRSVLGDLALGDLDRNFVATFYNLGDGPGPVFANGGPDYRRIGDDDFHGVPLWEAVNASSGAPIYFDPMRLTARGHRMLGVDGGLFANNPAMSAYVEAAKTFGADAMPGATVVSVGCGLTSLQFPQRRHWGLLRWASPLAGIPLMQAMFDGQAQTVSYQMAKLLGANFFRLNFELPPTGRSLDDAGKENLDRLVAAADAYLAQGGSEMIAAIAARL